MIKNRNKTLLPDKVGKTQAKDTGMAMVLILLLVAWFTDEMAAVGLALPVLVVNMVCPNVYKPLARIWLGISSFLGEYVSKLVLTLIFFLVVMPVGIARRWMGADPMQMYRWKKKDGSVFSLRDHLFRPKDLEKPY